MISIELCRNDVIVEIDDDAEIVTLVNVPAVLKNAGVRNGVVSEIKGRPAYQYIAEAKERGERAIECGVAVEWTFDDDVRLPLMFSEDAVPKSEDSADPDPSTSQGHESSQEPTLSAARSWLDLTEEIHRAGGAAGDLCISIDGVPAEQVVAEWEDGSRPRRAGEAIAVELERLGKRLTIHARWRDIPDNQQQEIDELALAPGRTPTDLILSSEATLGVELGADRPDGSVWVRRVDDGGAWAAAGGAAGDLCCTIDGISASQALAELASGTRPRLAGASIAVEIERLGERRIIYPCWREIPDAIKPPLVIDAATEPKSTTCDGVPAATVQAPLFTRPSPFQNLPALPPDHKRERPPRPVAYEWSPFRELDIYAGCDDRAVRRPIPKQRSPLYDRRH
jgi:hypothetical protein